MDADCDGKLNYQDFVNIVEIARSGEDISTISSFNTGAQSAVDPYI